MSEKKVVVITGASQGIGAGLVTAYLDAGYDVVANSRSIAPSGDDRVIAIAGDVGDPETAERVISEGVARFGRLDTLVNNAGIFFAKPFTEFTQADYERMVATNLTGFFNMTQRALRAMELLGSGHIVSITTTLVEQPSRGVAAGLTSLTKGGIDAVTRELAIEYASRGIRVNAVSPGVIRTTMHADKASHPALAALHPVGRMGDISDVVGAVMYLEHAPFVTGEISHVDGGQSAGRH